jgi:hypothetical protein
MRKSRFHNVVLACLANDTYGNSWNDVDVGVGILDLLNKVRRPLKTMEMWHLIREEGYTVSYGQMRKMCRALVDALVDAEVLIATRRQGIVYELADGY